jgi:hypothetical protein
VSIGNPRPALRHKDYRSRVEAVWCKLDEQILATAKAEGQRMTLDEALQYVLFMLNGAK